MAQKLDAAIPPEMDLNANYILKFTALSPTTGSVVSGVNVSQASLLVTNLAGTADILLESGPFMLVPGPEA